MTYTQSDLSNPYHGDFIFAVTQGSINAAMMNYLSNLPLPEIICVWVMSEGQHPRAEQIDFKELLRRANNSDPFKDVPPDADPTNNPALKNLAHARFIGGFKARIGLPPVSDPSTLPNIVTLGADVTSVKFNLLCAEFVAVQYTPGDGYGDPPSWMKLCQGTGTPWIFQTRVNLQLVKFTGDLTTLPAAVQDRIRTLNLVPDSFSIQRLLFDLDDAFVETGPTITGLPNSSSLREFLQKYFMDTYWTQLKANKQPVLAHAITANPGSSSLALTDLRFQISPYINGADPPRDPQDLYTLCYVGTTDNHKLPLALPPFTWNWIDDGQQQEWHGAVAVNRVSLGAWLVSALLPYFKTQCLRVHPLCSTSGGYTYLACYPQTGNDPTTISGATDGRLAYLAYKPDGEFSSAAWDTYEIKAGEDVTLEVFQSSETQIKIVQKVMVWLYVYIVGSKTSGYVVNSDVTSVYDLGVNDDGAVYFKLNDPLSSRKDAPDSLDWGSFANGMLQDPNGQIIDPVTSKIKALVNVMGSPSLSTARFIVPGHASVVYSGVKFSKGGDLAFHLTYGAS